VADIQELGNLIEGILWILIAACFLLSVVRPGHRGAKLIAAASFLVFGLSDFVEARTGAWWRPWWLLAWKAACVAVILVQFVWYFRMRRRTSPSATRAPAQSDDE